MCGIVSAISSGRNVVPILIQGLKRLEYRGYDSAGIAVINGRLQRIRSTGRVADLESRVAQSHLTGGIGIAHTRWATHGAPSERNAHPHLSGGISVVHNGIIENHAELRARLRVQGYVFLSDTDTEVIAHLVHSKLAAAGTLLAAVREALPELAGAYAIAVISDADPTHLVVARNGAPLLLGLGDGENFAASDSAALAAVTRQIVHLEDGDCAEITLSAVRIFDARGEAVERAVSRAPLAEASAELGDYRHYMQKEIFEQPAAVAATLAAAGLVAAPVPGLMSPDVDTDATLAGAPGDTLPPAPAAIAPLLPAIFGTNAEQVLGAARGVLILACGTSYHAAMVARYWLESVAGIACQVDIASEYRYREAVADPETLVVAISQSGETADTLAALRYAKTRGHRASLCLCNVAGSALMRAADLHFLTRAGAEIGVASTKAFTTQLVALALLTMVVAKLRGRLPAAREQEWLRQLQALPAALAGVLALEPQIERWAERLATLEHALFLGRGIHYPIAMEGALKLKEISYIHAEAYAAGELKHGPLALVNAAMPVIAIAPDDALIEKLKSNLQEVRARGGELYVFADPAVNIEGDEGDERGDGIHVIRLPAPAGFLSPILHTLPLQLLAYHVAVRRGNDVDKPRNLAKSVTVE